jgi:integrase
MGCKTFRGALVPPYPVADDLVPYCLRHTYCTDLQAAGIPINVARELMGHSDISVTAKIYTHSSEESIKDAADALERLNERRKNNIVENEKTVENL